MPEGLAGLETRSAVQGVEPAVGEAPVRTPAGWTRETRQIRVAEPQAEARKDVTYFRNPIGMEFVLVPPGAFLMGDLHGEHDRPTRGSPQHDVRITRAFLIGTCEVTQQQYEAVTGENPSHFRGARMPVERVSWSDATAFCARLSEKDGQTYRLPTESEWEYACRAGSTSDYSFGDDALRLDDHAWYSRNSGERPHEVGLKLPNAWGLYDMHGNVWEWCKDFYAEGFRPSAPEDPTGPAGGSYRVVRGGSWFDYPVPLRSGARGRDYPPNRADDHGFRVVCELRP